MRLGLIIGFVIVAMKLAYAIAQHERRALQAYLGHNNPVHGAIADEV
jgi:hypothetical protein